LGKKCTIKTFITSIFARKSYSWNVFARKGGRKPEIFLSLAIGYSSE